MLLNAEKQASHVCGGNYLGSVIQVQGNFAAPVPLSNDMPQHSQVPKPVTNPPSCGGCGKPTYQARVSSTIMIGKVPNEAYATLQAIPMTHHPDHVCKKPQSRLEFVYELCIASF